MISYQIENVCTTPITTSFIRLIYGPGSISFIVRQRLNIGIKYITGTT